MGRAKKADTTETIFFREVKILTPEVRATALVEHLHGPAADTMYHSKAVIAEQIRAAEITALMGACADVCDCCGGRRPNYERKPLGPNEARNYYHLEKRGKEPTLCNATPIRHTMAMLLTSPKLTHEQIKEILHAR